MKIVPLPVDTLKAAKEMDARMKARHEHSPWWRVPVDKLPKQAILAKSTGQGVVKQGVTVYLIAGHDRTVFPDGAPEGGLKVHEYVGLVQGTGWQPLVQLGRDIEFVS